MADTVIDAVVGDVEGFAFTPMSSPVDGIAVADSTRSAIPMLTAVFEDDARIDDERGTGRTTSEPKLHVVLSKLPQGVGKPDRFTRIKTGAVYEVRDWRPTDVSNLRATLMLIRINI